MTFVNGPRYGPSDDGTSDAVAIYQVVLDRLSQAALHGDTRILRTHIRLPFAFATRGGDFTIDTDDALIAYCLSFTETLRQLGTTDYIRLARSATFLGPHRIEGTHYTHIIRGAERIVAPYASRMIIEEKDGIWAVTRAAHSIGNGTLPIRMPENTPAREEPPPLTSF